MDEKVIQTLTRTVRMLEERVIELERAKEIFQNITVFRNGVHVYEKLVIPRKPITSGGACGTLAEVAQNTSDSDVYVCIGTWQRIGVQS